MRSIALIAIGFIAAYPACHAGEGSEWKTDGPETNAQVAAEGRCPLPWSPDSKNVQYVSYTGPDGRVIRFVRFEGPLASLRRYASRWFLKRLGQPGAPTARGTPAPAGPFDAAFATALAKHVATEIPGDSRPTPAGWFDTDKILHGEIYGLPKTDPGNAVFLIDTDRAVLYYWFAN